MYMKIILIINIILNLIVAIFFIYSKEVDNNEICNTNDNSVYVIDGR